MADDGTGFLSAFTFNVAGAAAGAGAIGAAGAVAAGAAAASSGSAGGFTMSRDEMTAMLTKAEGTRKLIGSQLQAAQNIAVIDPPGNDQASKDFTSVAVQSGDAYLKHLQIQFTRYTQLIAKLNQALGNTVATDDDAATAVQQPGAQGEY
jgi:hypothetical protein